MKNYFLLSISILLVSCDDCVDYLIENKTSSTLEIIYFKENSIDRNNIIPAHSSFSELSECDWGSYGLGYMGYYDSIQIKVDDIVRKTYYPTDMGKSIFKTQDRESWKLVESRKYYSKFVFEITEADLQ